MNVLQTVIGQQAVERLGWTLLHFLWQGFFIALLYVTIRRCVLRTSSPHAKYFLACAALAAMMAAPLATWELLRPPDVSPEASYRIRNTPLVDGNPDLARVTLPASARAVVSSVQDPQFLGWVVCIWLTGAIIFWARLIRAWIAATRMKSTMVRQATPEWQKMLTALATRIGYHARCGCSSPRRRKRRRSWAGCVPSY